MVYIKSISAVLALSSSKTPSSHFFLGSPAFNFANTFRFVLQKFFGDLDQPGAEWNVEFLFFLSSLRR